MDNDDQIFLFKNKFKNFDKLSFYFITNTIVTYTTMRRTWWPIKFALKKMIKTKIKYLTVRLYRKTIF